MAGCQPECEDIDSIFARGFGRPQLPPEDADLIWGGGDGGLSVLSNRADSQFDLLLDQLYSSTSTAVGMVRWSLVMGLDRVLVVEHPVPLDLGAQIPIETLLGDVDFTGGRGSRTFWNDEWRWTEGSTVAARAVLTEAFESNLTSTAVQGSMQIRQIAPVELRVGLSFATRRGATEVYWGDVAFDAAFRFDPCQ